MYALGVEKTRTEQQSASYKINLCEKLTEKRQGVMVTCQPWPTTLKAQEVDCSHFEDTQRK